MATCTLILHCGVGEKTHRKDMDVFSDFYLKVFSTLHYNSSVFKIAYRIYNIED